MRWEWPLMLKSTHRVVQVENYTLRDALKEANKELLKHRTLITELKQANGQTAEQLRRVFERSGQ